jgi:hypothetical protein
MEEASSLPVTNPANPGKSRRRRRLTVLLACILIATALWFLRALENEFITRVDHPVRFENVPDEMISLNPLPQRISLEVKGLGFSILRHNWNFSKTPLTIDIKQPKLASVKKKKGFVEYLPMNQFLSDFSSQLKDLKVLAVFPDTLILRFAYKKTRMVKVVPVFEYDSGVSPKPDSIIHVNPDSIEAEGPDLILDTLHCIRTLPIKINKQNSSFSRSLGLEETDKLVKLKSNKVVVSIGKKP